MSSKFEEIIDNARYKYKKAIIKRVVVCDTLIVTVSTLDAKVALNFLMKTCYISNEPSSSKLETITNFCCVN